MPTNVFIFECNSDTYLECVQKGLFASNLAWPLRIKKGDNCCLYHYEVGTLFALWQATSDGGKNLVPRLWRGRFPFQVKVALVTTEIISIPKAKLAEELLNPSTGKFDNVLEPAQSESLVQIITSSQKGATP